MELLEAFRRIEEMLEKNSLTRNKITISEIGTSVHVAWGKKGINTRIFSMGDEEKASKVVAFLKAGSAEPLHDPQIVRNKGAAAQSHSRDFDVNI